MTLSRRFRIGRRDTLGLVGIAILTVFVALALLGPVLDLPNPYRGDLRARMAAPTISWTALGAHPFGTDQLGRDILARMIIGSQATLGIAFSAIALGGVLGTALGLVAGYFGGPLDRVLMRLVDIQLALPLMLLALMVIAVFGPSLQNLILILALTSWVRYARIIRGQTLVMREREFVLASQGMGAGWGRILTRHILPNVMSSVLVVGSLELARVIVLEAGLSFLGFGIQPPSPSWGRMLADGRTYISSAWWIVTFPGLGLLVIVLGINLTGDWLRDRLDPNMPR